MAGLLICTYGHKEKQLSRIPLVRTLQHTMPTFLLFTIYTFFPFCEGHHPALQLVNLVNVYYVEYTLYFFLESSRLQIFFSKSATAKESLSTAGSSRFSLAPKETERPNNCFPSFFAACSDAPTCTGQAAVPKK